MKKLLSFAVLTLMGLTLMAKPVEPATAVQVARHFALTQLNAKQRALLGDEPFADAAVVYTHPMPESGRPAMYVVNLGSAFVIVAADDVAHPVLGYNMGRPWPTASNDGGKSNNRAITQSSNLSLPSQVSGFLDDLANQINAALQQNVAPDRGTASEWQQLGGEVPMYSSSNIPDSVGPLLTTTWDQGQYYNALCPEDTNGEGGHAVTGCVATAMAQIINYWGYPVHGRGTHSYKSDYGTLTVNYDSATYDYANMPNALTATSTPAQVNAVAKLMYDCGVATNMQYGSTESSSYDIDARAGMINFFRISPDASYAEKAYFSDTDWNNLLQTNLSSNLPVMYSGHGTGGHTFVCDGYNANDYYHFNFGWSGYADGWFTLMAINPAGSNYSSNQSAILGIIPDSTGNVILGQMAGTSTFTVDEPLEFYHLMGHNAYTGTSYSNSCSNNVLFTSADTTKQLVLDIISFEDQNITVYDGNGGSQLTALYAGTDNDLSPVVSTDHALDISYQGGLYYAGFQLNISQENGCRMVSNIVTSVDTTTVHLMWTENGSATQWQIEYGIKGFTLGNGTTYLATTNTATFSNLQKFTEYDFYIRSVCGDNLYGPWSKITLMIEASYWQDVVTSQPEGYVYDNLTNIVEISTAEGLAWWAKNGCINRAHLTADIDLSEYKWRPIYIGSGFDGKGHIISNVYINESSSDVGLFSDCSPGTNIENVGLVNAYVKSTSYRVGALFGTFRGIMRNCYVTNSSVDGSDYTGGLIGESDYGTVINCFVNTNVIGNRWTGLMIGNSWQGINRNCYAAGIVRHRSYCYMAGITAYAGAGEISNCYSVETEMGVVGYEGSTIISDTSTFVKTNSGCTLLTPIYFDDIVQTDLLTVLNLGVAQYNDSVYCNWLADTNDVNGGYPILGNKYEIQCPNISNLSIQNIKVCNDNAVAINWTENGNATQWLLRYRRHDRLDSAYAYVTLTNNPDTVYGITLGYAYDFSIRANCDTAIHSGWSPTYTLIVDLPYWTDVITTQPDGYSVDNDGNVIISSAEGLAWLAVMVNGLNGQQPYSYYGKTVTLSSDIDLTGYRWKPIGGYFYLESSGYNDWLFFNGTFDGLNHRVSNIYINDAYSDLGLFGHARMARIKNVSIDGGYIASIYTDSKDPHFLHSSAIGGLLGFASDCYEISNCHSSANVYANGGVGSLCGEVSTYGGFGESINGVTNISNCSASGIVYGRESCGGLIGTVFGDVVVCNSFATGNVEIADGSDFIQYRGGLIGLCQFSSFYNNYSIGEVTDGGGKVIGSPCNNPQISYVYSQDSINVGLDLIGGRYYNNTALFHHIGFTNTLLTPITLNESSYTDLLDALNAWVTLQNDPSLRMWVLDSLTGYPVFGSYYVPTCYNPINLTVSQATTIGDTVIKTQLAWTQMGEPDHWEVLYVASEKIMDSGTIVTVTTNPYVLTDIITGHPLDFYVRAVCGENEKSHWCGPVTYIPDKLRWTEVVTSQPEGYQVDSNGNVFISSAEGLAWLSSVVNCLNGVSYSPNRFYDKTICLLSDIDISAYRWTHIGKDYNVFLEGAIVKGNNHTITGLYCNELDDYQGLFGYFWGGSISNLILHDCNVFGENYSGSIVGYALGVNLVNCGADGNVTGIDEVGGLVGRHSTGSDGYISNSYFIGETNARRDISKANTNIGYVGGICGSPYNDSITNCYVVSEITNDGVWSGIITGTGMSPNAVSNCYYKTYETSLPITSSNCYTANNSSFSGSGTTWTLDTPSYINGTFWTDLVDALNAWVDANNTDGIYRHWAADSANVNGGFPVFAAIPCPLIDVHDTVAVCDTYTWNGNTYISSIVVTDTLSAINGCDSTVTLHLTINQSTTGDTTATACDSFTWQGTTYTSSGDVHGSAPLQNAAGCDSVVMLHLTINNPIHTAIVEVACETYTWNGTSYTASGNYTYNHTDNNGCMQADTLHLTINNPVHTATTETACETYTWNGTAYTTSGNYTFSHADDNGCTQVDTLHLTINNPVHTATTETACETYTWNSTTYTTSGNYTYSHADNNSCMQVDTLHLTIYNPVHTATTEVACETYTWNGTTYTTSGNYTYSHANNNGCTQVDTLHLTINNPINTAITEVACETYTWNDSIYTTSGDYINSHVDANSCTQVDTLHLTINHDNAGVETITACNSFLWHGVEYTQSTNEPTYTSLNVNGCDSVTTLNLTINHCSTTEITACDSYLWMAGNGQTYTESGEYYHGTDTLQLTIRHSTEATIIQTSCDSLLWNGVVYYYTPLEDPMMTIVNSVGCDSVITLHLTINHSTLGDTMTVACESFTWWNTNYTNSTNDATHVLTNAVGCDSTVTLHLTINNPLHTATSETACEIYTWNGTAYTTSGNYTFSHADDNGCTQVDTLHLTINNPVHTATTETACETYTWNSTTYTTSGNYTYSHADNNSCMQVDTLHLTIYNPVHTATTEVACETYTWNGTTYTTGGNYTYSHADNNGCTQVDTLYLTIDSPVAIEIYDTVCDSYNWNGTDYTVSGEYVRTLPSTVPGGCDTTVTLHLIVNYSVVVYDSITIASTELPYNYLGNTIEAEGDYTFTGVTTEGCDSTMNLNVTVNQVGIGNVVDGTDVRVYPNPTDGVVTVEGRGVECVEVMDISGRVLIDRKCKGSTDCRIDISMFRQGAYLLRVTTVEGVSIRKVVKQ